MSFFLRKGWKGTGYPTAKGKAKSWYKRVSMSAEPKKVKAAGVVREDGHQLKSGRVS
jgi:hypothetical protein